MLSSSDAEEDIVHSFHAGASGCISKTARPAELFAGFLACHAGQRAMRPTIERRLAEQWPAGGRPSSSSLHPPWTTPPPRHGCRPGSAALAYGLYELSRRIGVSPWYWWADMPIVRQEQLRLGFGTKPIDQPAVKYRGIFLNDENWGLQP
jgi:hypothetical protein